MTESTVEQGPALLMRMVTGLWAARTLAVAHDFGVFERADIPQGVSASEFAEDAGLAARPSQMLLTACAGLGLLRLVGDGRYANTPLSSNYLVTGKPGYFGGIVRMLDQHSGQGWLRLEDALRRDGHVTWDAAQQKSIFDDTDPKFVELFWEGMYTLSIPTAGILADHVDFGRTERLLDVGGGGGAYDIVLCRRHPSLTATVFDLPQACTFTQGKIEQAGLADRISVKAGDMFASVGLPQGYDTILLSMVLHDWDEHDCQTVLEHCWRALPSGGQVVINELLVNDAQDGPADAALMSLEMLIETAGGSNYSSREYTSWLEQAGFQQVRTVRFEAPGSNGAVIGQRL